VCFVSGRSSAEDRHIFFQHSASS